MRKKMIVLGLMLCMGLAGGVYGTEYVGQDTLTRADKKAKKELKKQEPALEKTEVKMPTPYEMLFKGKKTRTVKSNFITIHKIEDKVYFEFPFKYLNREMIISSVPSQASNNVVCSIGLRETRHIKFTREDTLICLRKVNSSLASDPREKNIGIAVRENTLDPVVESYRIQAYNPDSTAAVIDVTGLFLRENEFLPLFPSDVDGLSVSARYNSKTESFLTEMKSFDDNLTIKTMMSFEVSLKYLLFPVYQNNVSVEATRSLLLLPEEKMRPRIADTRVGIFLNAKDYLSTSEDQIRRYYLANRWRVEPKDEKAYRKGALVEPKKPIVFYMDDAFPELWKKAIRQGTLRWNKAFEKIGFKNVLQVREYPKDDPSFDPDNLKYSCIRYIPSATENAMGMSYVDPSTGEIIAATVLVYNDVVKIINNWRFIQTAQLDPSVRSKKMPDDILEESIAYVVAHEVGHTLGFMHNMSASAAYPVDSLRSAKFTKKYGTTPSIMDYARFNYVAQPGDKGVRLTPPDLGVYDYFLVKWSYQCFPNVADMWEEAEELEKIVDEKAGDPIYRYGRQQLYSRYDPSALEEDLGDDPMKAGMYGIKNLQYILQHMDEWIKKDYDGSHKQDLYSELVNQYYRYIRNVVYNIGGIYLTAVKEGTPGEPYRSVSREVQKASFAWLMNEFRTCDWLDNQELKDKFPIGVRGSHVIRNRVAKLLKDLYKGILVSAYMSKEENPYTVSEFFEDYYQEVFAPTIADRELSDADKMLQTITVDMMVSTFVGEKKDKGLLNLVSFNAAYAPSLEDRLAYRLDESGVLQLYEKQLRAREMEQGYMVLNANPLRQFGQGYGWQQEVSVAAIDNSQTDIFAMAMKTKELLESKISSAQGATKAHYQTLLYKLQRMLK